MLKAAIILSLALLILLTSTGQSETYKLIFDGDIAATFLSDVTIPDGTLLKAGQRFTKTWKFKNTGTSAWDGYKLAFVDGEKMDAPPFVPVPLTPPGESVDISVTMTAPIDAGRHQSYWHIQTATGEKFGPLVYLIIHVKSSTYNEREYEAWLSDIDSESPAIRIKAVEALSSFGSISTPILIKLFLSDPDEDVRKYVLAGLASIKPPSNEIIRVLIEAVNDLNLEIATFAQIYISEELRFHIGPDNVPILLEALNGMNSTISKQYAIQLLAQIGLSAKEAVPTLRELSQKDPEITVRKLASEALKLIDP